MRNILLHALTAIAYLTIAWSIRPEHRRFLVLLIGTVALHGALLWEALFPGGGLRLGFASVLSLMIWLTMVIYLLESLTVRLDWLLRIALIVAAPLSLLPLLFPSHRWAITPHSLLFDVHLLLAMLAYGLFTLAMLHALLMDWAETRLRHGKLPPSLNAIPSLMALEILLFRLIFIAFLLLSLTLLTGIWFSEGWQGRSLPLNNKTVFSIISWLLFAVLLWGRRRRGWRGRKARWWIIGGFIALLIAYVGSSFVFDVLLRTEGV